MKSNANFYAFGKWMTDRCASHLYFLRILRMTQDRRSRDQIYVDVVLYVRPRYEKAVETGALRSLAGMSRRRCRPHEVNS
jgi:hypothetical protein